MLSPRVLISWVISLSLLCALAGCTQLKERFPMRKAEKVAPTVTESGWKEKTSAEGTTLPPNTALPVRKQVGGEQ